MLLKIMKREESLLKSMLNNFKLDKLSNIQDSSKIIFVMLLLLCTGLIYCLAAGSMQALRVSDLEFYFLIKQLIACLIGACLIVVACKIPLNFYRKLVFPVYVITVLMLLAVFFSHEINGSRRWLNFPIFSIQPSEFAKFTIILYLAHYLDKKNDEIKDLIKGFLPACILLGVIVLLILIEPDIGTSFLLALVALSLFFIAGANTKHLLGIVSFCLPILIMLLFVGYRRERLFSFLNPWDYHNTSGYQLIQSLISVGSGGIFGKGLGNSTQKLYYLPEIHTDFVYAAIGEELGFIGCLIILLLVVYLFFLCLRSAERQKDNFKFLLIFGISVMLVYPSFIHMAVVLGLMPTKGITLPFVSYGGSSLVVNMFFIGLILRSFKELT